MRKPVNDKVKSDREKIKGAAMYFEKEDNNLSGTDPSPKPELQPSPEPSPDTPPQPDTVTDTDTLTDTSPLIKPTEVYIRKVGYFLEHQSKFIVKKAKQYKVKEAEIMRIAVEELIKSGKI